MNTNLSISSQPWMVGLMVFGGKDPCLDSDFELDMYVFSAGFTKEAYLGAWEKVGLVPLTMACLDNPKVQWYLGDENNDVNAATRLM